MSVFVHEENAFVPSQYNLFGTTELKVFVPDEEVRYMEYSVVQSVMRKVPVPGQLCDDARSNQEIGLSRCVAEIVQGRLGCRFPWSAGENSSKVCEDDAFSTFAAVMGNVSFWTQEDIFNTRCRPSCETNEFRLAPSIQRPMPCNISQHCRE